jgi:hypothetical protein
MQILVVIMMFLAMTASALLGGRSDKVAAQQDYFSDQGDLEAARFDAVARAAWFAARENGPGSINIASLVLPPNLRMEPAFPYQAWSDGTFVYVWGGRQGGLSRRLDTIMSVADAGTNVGISDSASVRFRSGATVARPAAVPSSQVIVRIHL